ncbi:MFS transporter [Devosia pacifica]|uniref:MFS transporter n=1 Tax=Devosia pacifica TaxID=1335967 RepID=A0A918VS63_9HYPH|nr:MFS transporter [Devosia pacifica]GHA24395.1 MFS transporter [Devosia pacifica]
MSDRLVQRLTMLVFFLQPLALGSWLVRIPDVQDKLDLGPGALAVALLGLPCGTLATLPFAGPLIGRIGARTGIIAGFVYYCVAISLPAFASDSTQLFVALVFAGSSVSFVELALNVKADRVEKATGRMIMTTSHGFWSLGIMAGSLIGSGFAAIGLAAHWAVLLVAAISLPLGVANGVVLPRYPAEEAPEVEGGGKRSAWSPPSLALLGICLFTFGVTMTEGAMADWSAVFLRETFSSDGGQAGLGYSVFAFMVAAGRFCGDWLRARYGAVTLARGCGVFALAGVTLLIVSPNVAVAMVGFAVVGVGVSVGFPLAVTAAAALGDRAASANVAVLSFMALLGFLVGPPVIGFIAEHFDMRAGLVALLPVLLVSLLLAGRLRSRKTGMTS